MMGGIGMMPGHAMGLGGHGLGGLLGGQPDIRDLVEGRVDHLKSDVESGRVDVADLQKRLIERFGDAAEGIVGDDGKVDFDKLVEVITTDRIASLHERLVARFGDDAEGLLDEDGTIDTDALRDLIVAKRTERFEDMADRRIARLRERVDAGQVDLAKLQERLTAKFGDDAKGIVGIDGTIDYDAIKSLMVEQRTERLENRLDRYFEDDDVIDLDMLRDFIVARKTAQYESTADRLIERLKERVADGDIDLAKLQERLTDRFGEDAAGIVGIDGTIDYDAIKSLYVESRVDRLNERLDARFDDSGAIDMDMLRDMIVSHRTKRFEAIADRIVDRLEKRVEAGRVDLENLQERLTKRFGEDAAGIVGIDGTVDYDAIKGLIVDRMIERLNERLDAPRTDDDIVGRGELRDMIVAHHKERYEAFADRVVERIEKRVDEGKAGLADLQERLTKRFGDDAKGIVGIDGTIDTDRIKSLIVDSMVERLENRIDTRFEDDGSVEKDLLRDMIVAHRTKRFEAQAERRVERLERRVEAGRVDLETLQERLTDKFGDDAKGIVGIDGTVDYDAIKDLIVERKVERLEERLDERFGGDGDDDRGGFYISRDRFAMLMDFAFRAGARYHQYHHHGHGIERPFVDYQA